MCPSERRAQVICLCSAKGGSGKTTVTAALGTFLAAVGKRVLLVDADEATMGLTLLYLREVDRHRYAPSPRLERTPRGLFEFVRDLSMEDMTPIAENLQLFPAAYNLGDSGDSVLQGGRAGNERISVAVKMLRGSYDYVLVDSQAGIEDATRVSASRGVSDVVVIVSEFDPMSVAGIKRLEVTFPSEMSFDRTWILLNKMLPEFAREAGDFMEVFRHLPPIAWNADVVRAYARRGLALNLQTGNEYTYSVMRLLKVLLGPPMDDRIDRWVESRVRAMRIPLRQRYEEVEAELHQLRRACMEQALKRDRWRSLSTGGSIIAVSAVAAWTLFAVTSGRTPPEAVPSVGAAMGSVVLAIFVSWFLSRRRVNREDEDLWAVRQRERELGVRLEQIETLLTAEEASVFASGGNGLTSG